MDGAGESRNGKLGSSTVGKLRRRDVPTGGPRLCALALVAAFVRKGASGNPYRFDNRTFTAGARASWSAPVLRRFWAGGRFGCLTKRCSSTAVQNLAAGTGRLMKRDCFEVRLHCSWSSTQPRSVGSENFKSLQCGDRAGQLSSHPSLLCFALTDSCSIA